MSRAVATLPLLRPAGSAWRLDVMPIVLAYLFMIPIAINRSDADLVGGCCVFIRVL
jgi:hypothetical protein